MRFHRIGVLHICGSGESRGRGNGATAKRFFKHLLHGLQDKPYSSRTACAAMVSLSERSCPMFGIGRAGT